MKQSYLFKLFLLIAFVVIGAFEAFAYDFEVNGIFYNIHYLNASPSTDVYVTYKGPSSGYPTNEYTGLVTIPETVTYNGATYSVIAIGSYAFRGYSGLTSIVIPNSVTGIGDQAFYGCTGLMSASIGNSVTSIGESAFQGCSGLTSLTIPNSVTSVGSSAFRNCSGLMSAIIGNSVTSIGSYAFANCRKLKRITIPYPVTSLGSGAFHYCEDLTDVTCLAVTPPSMGNYNTIFPAYYMATLHVLERSFEAYKATDWWNCFINIVDDASEDDSTPSDAPTDKCDTNDDGEINITDVNRVIDAILGH